MENKNDIEFPISQKYYILAYDRKDASVRIYEASWDLDESQIIFPEATSHNVWSNVKTQTLNS